VRTIAAWRGLGGNREVPPNEIRAGRGDPSGAYSAAYFPEEGGPRGKHGFPRATERSPKAVAEEAAMVRSRELAAGEP
jgi:hypothetical protein